MRKNVEPRPPKSRKPGASRKSPRDLVTEAHTTRAALEALCAGTAHEDGAVINTCVHLARQCPDCWSAVGQLEPWLPPTDDRNTAFIESLRDLADPREAEVGGHYELFKAVQDAPRRRFAFAALLVENAFTMTLTNAELDLSFYEVPIAVLDILAALHPSSMAVRRVQARCDARRCYVLAKRGETEEAAKILDTAEARVRVAARDTELEIAIGVARAMIFRIQGDAQQALLCYGKLFDQLPYPSFAGLGVIFELLDLLLAMGETDFADLLIVLKALIQSMGDSHEKLCHIALLKYTKALAALPKGSVSETDLAFAVDELERVQELFCDPFAKANYEQVLGHLLSHSDTDLSLSHYRRALEAFIEARADGNFAVVAEEAVKLLAELEDGDLKRELMKEFRDLVVHGLAKIQYAKRSRS